MTRAFNIERLVRLQNYMGGKTLSDAQFFAVLNTDVVEMIDVSGLFFILPEGTQFPYTLTEEDKAKLSAATVLILPTTGGATPFQRGSNEVIWCSLRYTNTIWVAKASESSISAPVAFKIFDDTAIRFTAQTLTAAQKTQAIRQLRQRNLYCNTSCHL